MEKGAISSHVLTLVAVAVIGGVIISAASFGIVGVAVGDDGASAEVSDIISTMTGSATIGEEADPPGAREQFRQLVAFNNLAAQQCSILGTIAMADNVANMDDEDLEEAVGGADIGGDDTSRSEIVNHLPENLGGNPEEVSTPVEDQTHAYIRWLTESSEQSPFGRIKETGYHGKCFGARLDLDIMGAVVEATVPDVLLEIGGAISSIFSGDNVPYEGKKFAGGRMQGTPGSISLEIKQNFTIRDPRLMDLDLGSEFSEKKDGANHRVVKSGRTPPHWRGERPVLFYPGGINPEKFFTDEASNAASEGGRIVPGAYIDENPARGFLGISSANDIVSTRFDPYYALSSSAVEENPGRHFWNARVRMTNIPTFSSIETSDMQLPNNVLKRDVFVLDQFVANSAYVFCEGMSGRIQTNTGSPNDDSNPGGKDPIWRDVPFTFVELSDPGIARNWKDKKCINIPENRWDDPGNDYGSSFTYTDDYATGDGTIECEMDIEDLVGVDKVKTPEAEWRTIPFGHNAEGEEVEMEATCGWRQRSLSELVKNAGIKRGWGEEQWLYNWEVIFPEVDGEGNTQEFEENYDITSLANINYFANSGGEFTIEEGSNGNPTLLMEGRGTANYNVEYFDGEKLFVGLDRGEGIIGAGDQLGENLDEDDFISIEFETVNGDDIKLKWRPSKDEMLLQVDESYSANQDTYGIDRTQTDGEIEWENKIEYENPDIDGHTSEDVEGFGLGVNNHGLIYYSLKLREHIEVERDDRDLYSLRRDSNRWGENYEGSFHGYSEDNNYIIDPSRDDEGEYENKKLTVGNVEKIIIEKSIEPEDRPQVEDKVSVLSLGHSGGN